MKNNLLVAALVLGGTALAVTTRKRSARQRPTRRTLTAQPLYSEISDISTIVYFMSDISRYQPWYDAFFSPYPGTLVRSENGYPLRYPFVYYLIDGIEVILTADPEYRIQKPAIYYWALPDTAAIGDLCRRISRTEITLGLPNPLALPTGSVTEVVFTAPDDNKIGVINNPIYTPKLAD